MNKIYKAGFKWGIILSSLLLVACESNVENAANYLECGLASEGLKQEGANQAITNTFNVEVMREDDKAIDADEFIDATYIAKGRITSQNNGDMKQTYLDIYNSKYCQKLHNLGELQPEQVDEVIDISLIGNARR